MEHEVDGLVAACPSWPRLFAYRAFYQDSVGGVSPEIGDGWSGIRCAVVSLSTLASA